MLEFIYSHRGLLDDSDPNIQNTPAAIDKAINEGFKVEIDLRYKENQFFLGHDQADHPISVQWLKDREFYLLLHTKDPAAAAKLAYVNRCPEYFAHAEDDFVLTSYGHIWCHNINLPLNEMSIIPLINKADVENFVLKDRIYAIATDFPYLAREKWSKTANA